MLYASWNQVFCSLLIFHECLQLVPLRLTYQLLNLQEDQQNKLLIGSFLEDAVKHTVGRPEMGSVELINMMDGCCTRK